MILNYRHAQRRRVSIFFHTIPGVASRETAFPRYPHVLPPLRGAGALRRNVRVPTWGGGGDPLPGPHPRGDTPAVHSMGRSRRRTGYGFPLAIAMTALAPGRGRGRSAKRGWGGGTERNFRVPFCPGRGRAPSPVPSPRGDIPTVHSTGRTQGRTRFRPALPGLPVPSRETDAAATPGHGLSRISP